MSAPAPMLMRETTPALLRLAPGCTILPDAGVLYVLTRRGSFDLRAAGIDQLHERLRSFLNGTHTEADLLTAVGPKAAAKIETYLARLRDIGAFSESNNSTADAHTVHAAAASLGSSQPALTVHAGRLRVHVSLDGPLPLRTGALTLCFATPPEAARLLSRLRGPTDLKGRLTCVVVDGEPGHVSEAEMEQRATQARWLLRMELDVLRDRSRVQVYASAAEGVLSLRATAEREHLSTLSRQLDLLRAASVDQLPLVVAEASHAWFNPVTAAFGLDVPGVEDHLLRRFLARLVIGSGDGEAQSFRLGAIGTPLHARIRVGQRRPSPSGMIVAPSLAALDLELLEVWADARVREATLPWRTADLLTENTCHPVLEHLRDILRLRRERLPARLAVTTDGLLVCRAGGLRTRSYIPEKAIAEMLLRSAWQEFHADTWTGDAPEAVCATTTFASNARIRRIVQEKGGSRPPSAAVGKLRCWGTLSWAGMLEEAP